MGGPTLFLAIVIKHGVSYKACKQHSPDATFTGISKKYSISILFMISLTECVWEFQNNALWDTRQHALIN